MPDRLMLPKAGVARNLLISKTADGPGRRWRLLMVLITTSPPFASFQLWHCHELQKESPSILPRCIPASLQTSARLVAIVMLLRKFRAGPHDWAEPSLVSAAGPTLDPCQGCRFRQSSSFAKSNHRHCQDRAHSDTQCCLD